MRFVYLVWLIIFMYLPNHLYSQSMKIGEYDVIFWSENYQLKRNDFKFIDMLNHLNLDEKIIHAHKKPQTKYLDYKMSGGGNAESRILIAVCMDNEKDTIRVKVYNIFIRDLSWYKGELSNQLLEHEQIHFDISEYYLRLIRSYLLRRKFETSIETYSFIELFRGMIANTHLLFDLESNRGHNLKVQIEWKTDIENKIKSLEMYSGGNYSSKDYLCIERSIQN